MKNNDQDKYLWSDRTFMREIYGSDSDSYDDHEIVKVHEFITRYVGAVSYSNDK